jgi:hypothetical protein
MGIHGGKSVVSFGVNLFCCQNIFWIVYNSVSVYKLAEISEGRWATAYENPFKI